MNGSNCSLKGPRSTRTKQLHVLLTFQLFGRRIAQGARQFDQLDPFLRLRQFSVRCAQLLSASTETNIDLTIARRGAPTFNRPFEGEWLQRDFVQKHEMEMW